MADTYNGQDLVDLTVGRLSGYGNAVNPEDVLSAVNEGKDEVWAVLKNLEDEYFVTPSQTSDSTLDTYFASLTTSAREYDLPADFKEIRFIECTTVGYEDLKFTYRKLSDPDFQGARKAATADGVSSTPQSEYLYAIVAKGTFMLANYPEVALSLKLWYVRGLQDLETDTPLTEIISPYVKKIADFAAKKIMLGLKDPEQFAAWKQEWKDSIMTLTTSASPRNQADAEFVQDFTG